jgi:hypothetical protein
VARTGAVRWWMGRPAWCGVQSADSLWRTASLAVGGGLVAAAEFCGSGATAVVRVDPASGRLLWSRPVSAAADGGTHEPVTVAGVAAQPGVVVVAGELEPGQAGGSRAYPAPAGLGPTDTRQALLALDAASGQPLWTAATGPVDAQVGVTGVAVCRSPPAGVECRNARTGTPLGPALATGQATGPGPPNKGDAYAGAASTVLAVTLAGPAAAPPSPRRGVLVRLLPLRGGAAMGGTSWCPASYLEAAVSDAVVDAVAAGQHRLSLELRVLAGQERDLALGRFLDGGTAVASSVVDSAVPAVPTQPTSGRS